MTTTIRHLGSANPATPFPTTIERRSIAVNTANRQIVVGDENAGSVGAPIALLAIRFFDARAQYATNDLVVQNGVLYRAIAAIPPGSFNATNWLALDVSQMVLIDGSRAMTGNLTLANSTPPSALIAASKGYVDAQTAPIAAAAANKVAKAGDTMSGDLTISKSWPLLVLDRADGVGAYVYGRKAGSLRWALQLGTNEAETGANVGSNLSIVRCDDTGTPIDQCFIVNRKTGIITANSLVSYAEAQALTVAQQEQARKNVFAAPFDALAYNGMQINGAMEVSQENGTTFVGASVGQAIDGWYAYRPAGAGVFSCGQFQMGVFGRTLPTFLLQANTAQAIPVNDAALMYQLIEGKRVARLAWGSTAAAPVTVGFWILTNAAGMATCYIANPANNRCIVQEFSVVGNSTWEYKKLTFAGDQTGTWPIDNTSGMTVGVCCASGGGTLIAPNNVWSAGAARATAAVGNLLSTSGYSCVITQFGIWPGTEAPSPERSFYIMRPYAEELALCRRYWRRQQFSDSMWLGDGNSYQRSYPIAPTMRGQPTVTLASLAGSNTAAGWPVISSVGPDYVSVAIAGNVLPGVVGWSGNFIINSRMS
jgi:hypothetical protein